MLRYGIIGCGFISTKRHIPAIEKIKEARILAVADVNKNVAKKTASEYNVKYWFTDYKKMLKFNEIDVVVIALPTPLHKQACIDSANTGKHIYVEKPIATSLEDANEIIDICHKKKVKLCVGHTQRFFPVYRKAKELIEKGYLGNVYKIRIHNCLYIDWTIRKEKKIGSQWRIDPNNKFSGPLMDVGCHYLDSLRYLLEEEPVRIYAEIDRFVHKHRKSEDNVTILIRFNKGAIAALELSESQYMDKNEMEGVEIYGSEGSLRYKSFDNELELRSTKIDSKAKSDRKIELSVKNQSCMAFIEIHRKFLKSIKNNIIPPVSGEDAYKTLAMIEAGYQSSEDKRAVSLL